MISKRLVRVVSVFAMAATSLVSLTPRTALSAEIDASTVQQSIDRGVQYIRGVQNQRGGWDEYGSQSCGLSALCTLAMINAGVSRDDPALVSALQYLRKFEPNETYSVALQTLVFCQVGAAGDLPKIRRNVGWLTDVQKPAGSRNAGAWSYDNRGDGNGDPSNSQFAVLALGAAADRGVVVPPDVFRLAADYWRRVQLRDGGWGYGSMSQASGSMTCAGIASLIIARSNLPDATGATLVCCGDGEDDSSLQRAQEFFGKIFSVRNNPGGELFGYYYYMYAIERVGRLSGRRLIGDRDWYREGAAELISRQDNFQGFWAGDGPVESNRTIATSFAVLFLSKGKRQVVVGRMDHPSLGSSREKSGPPHPRALQNLVKHVEKDWSRDLTWQTIVGERAGVADLLQTPVLVIAGQTSLKFREPMVQALGEYLDQGGTILFDAQAGDGCGNADAFEKDVLALCQKWYPGASMDRLPPSHPVWFAERSVDPDAIGNGFWMYGLGACCRTPVFYSPRSLTCRWSLGDQLLNGSDLPAAVRQQATAGIAIGENIIAYATGRELKDKLQASEIIDGSDAPPPGRSAVSIAVGALGAGERQVQRALPNAASLIRDRLAVQVIAVDEPISLTDESLANVGALYLHGQTEFELTDTSRRALRNYLQRFGILVASPICASESFADSFRREIGSLVDGGRLELMPPDHSAFTTAYGGYDLTEVTIRTPRQLPGGGPGRNGDNDGTILLTDDNADTPGGGTGPQRIARRTGSPIIEFGKTDGVANVFFSPLDLSCALESQNSVQCPGYATTDAAKILGGVLLFALQQ